MLRRLEVELNSGANGECSTEASTSLGNQTRNRLGTFNTHQPLIKPAIEIAEPIRNEPKLIQDRRVDPLNMCPLLNRPGAEFIGLSIANAALDPTASCLLYTSDAADE